MNKHRSYRGGREYLVQKIGEVKVAEFEDWTRKRGKNGKVKDEVEFYDFKNQSLEMSLAISEVFDSDYIRNICNWISDNRGLFGKRILDVGCDCGLITCFVAEYFPEAEVVGIDRSSKAVECAKELSKRLALRNVTFLHIDANSYNETYDTVIYSRVTQENFDEKDVSVFDTFFNTSEFYKQQVGALIEKVSSLLAENGSLISFEMVDLNPLCYAIIRTIVNNNCLITGMDKMIYTELDEPRSVRVIVSKKEGYEEYREFADNLKKATIAIEKVNQLMVPYFSSSPEVMARIAFHQAMEREMKIGAPQYFEWEANYMLDSTADKLIDGYYLYFDIQSRPYFYSLWTNINDETAIIYFGVPNDNEVFNHSVEWSNNDISNKEKMLEMIRGLHIKAIEGGHLVKVTKAVYEDNHIREIEIPLQTIAQGKVNSLQSVGDIAAYLKK